MNSYTDRNKYKLRKQTQFVVATYESNATNDKTRYKKTAL